MALDALQRHPLSALWGDMPHDEFEALVADVRAHGVRQPIALFRGRVIDGWHRLQAAIRAGLHDMETFKIEDSPEGDDPAGYRHRLPTDTGVTSRRRNGSRRSIAAERWSMEDHNNCGPRLNSRDRRAGRCFRRRWLKQVQKAACVRDTAKPSERAARRCHSLRRKERDRLSKKGETPPLTRMEKLEAENERLRLERDALAEAEQPTPQRRSPH